jgi:hypothetical protein
VRNEGKIDELNEIASHAHDPAHAELSSPILVAGEGVQSLTSDVTEAKRVATDEMSNPSGGRESVRVLKANNGGMSTVQLPEGEALNYIAKLIEEIENDHPELTMYNELRAMSTVTGPAAERMIGDAAAYIVDARANYDTQSIKLFQMAVAIAGWRVNTGAWGTLTRQQQAFASFDLESYGKGDLDFEIGVRPIVPSISKTPDEQRALMEQAERGFATRTRVIEALGGDPEADMAEIDRERNAQEQNNAATVEAVMERVRGQQQQPQPVAEPVEQGA